MKVKFTDKLNKDDSWIEEYPALDEITDEFIFRTDKTHSFIQAKLPESVGMQPRKGSQLKIMLPHFAKVIFSGVSTNLEIAKLNNDAISRFRKKSLYCIL